MNELAQFVYDYLYDNRILYRQIRRIGIIVLIRYKINVIDTLKNVGYSTYRIRKEHMFSEGTITKFRNSQPVAIDIIDKLCQLLDCQPGDLLEYVPDENGQS